MSSAEELREEFGGHWGEHPDHKVEDWKQEVANDETRLGYWEWLEAGESWGEED